jgi:hypothetical protein
MLLSLFLGFLHHVVRYVIFGDGDERVGLVSHRQNLG